MRNLRRLLKIRGMENLDIKPATDTITPKAISSETGTNHDSHAFTFTNDNLKALLDEDLSLKIPENKLHKFSIAPMMDITYIHFRFLMRLLTRYSTLWTEMIHSNAIVHNEEMRAQMLKFYPIEHPIVIQVGGGDPEKLREATKLAEKEGYDEIDLNCGCPSERVQSGSFGAILMLSPDKVSDCIKSMNEGAEKILVHVKCRIGVDEQDSYDFVKSFVQKVSTEGECKHFIIHSRKGILSGLSPHDNRTIPPLKYEVVKQLKKDFPDIDFSINGGIKTYDQIEEFLNPEYGLTGVMVGRLAYENPWILSDIDRRVYGLENPRRSRREVLLIYGEYGDHEIKLNPKIKWPVLNKPIINLFYGEKNSSGYRRILSDIHTFKKMEKYSDLIKYAISELEKTNKDALDQCPPPLQ